MSVKNSTWKDLSPEEKLLDLTIVSFFILLTVSVIFYLFFLEKTVQNALPFLVVFILLATTWSFKIKVNESQRKDQKSRYLIEWVLASGIFIILGFLLIIFYPVS